MSWECKHQTPVIIICMYGTSTAFKLYAEIEGKSRETSRVMIDKKMAGEGKTCSEVKWLAQGRSELWKLICAYASKGNGREGKHSWCELMPKVSKEIMGRTKNKGSRNSDRQKDSNIAVVQK